MPSRLKRMRERKLSIALATGDFHTLMHSSRLPPLPAHVIRLVGLCEDPSSDASAVAEVISLDPGLAAWILRLANSAAFGVAVRIANVRRAVVTLGMRRVRDYALGRAAIGNLREIESDQHDGKRFWAESLQRGILAAELARKLVPGAEGEAFAGGLLQDMAVPALFAACPEEYGGLAAGVSGPALAVMELEAFGWSHAQAGAWLATDWGFPNELVCAIGMHHESYEEIAKRSLLRTPVGVVSFTGGLHSPCNPETEELQAFSSQLEHWYEITPAEADDILVTAESCFLEALEVFNLPRPEEMRF
ncbi:MAG: HDOD domain-containing protein [Planctomycetota bacterium]